MLPRGIIKRLESKSDERGVCCVCGGNADADPRAAHQDLKQVSLCAACASRIQKTSTRFSRFAETLPPRVFWRLMIGEDDLELCSPQGAETLPLPIFFLLRDARLAYLLSLDAAAIGSASAAVEAALNRDRQLNFSRWQNLNLNTLRKAEQAGLEVKWLTEGLALSSFKTNNDVPFLFRRNKWVHGEKIGTGPVWYKGMEEQVYASLQQVYGAQNFLRQWATTLGNSLEAEDVSGARVRTFGAHWSGLSIDTLLPGEWGFS